MATILGLLVFMAVQAREEAVVLKITGGELHGTLLLPETQKTTPVVLLISGSGPTDRDGNNPQMKNNSLKLLAEAIAEKGIASLRFDKRGIAASQTAGQAEKDVRFEHYAEDVKEWIALLKKDHRFSQIIVAGHSEGSLIGMLAAQNNSGVSKYISIAGPARKAGDILRFQLESQPEPIKKMCLDAIETLEKGDTIANVSPLLYSLFRPSVQPYLISWLRYTPSEEFARLTIPTLIVQGTTDIQVAEEEASLLHQALPAARICIIKNMNHVLKECDTMDKALQMPSYYTPDMPLHQELAGCICGFILAEK